jgi:hypothetical protein
MACWHYFIDSFDIPTNFLLVDWSVQIYFEISVGVVLIDQPWLCTITCVADIDRLSCPNVSDRYYTMLAAGTDKQFESTGFTPIASGAVSA